MMNLAAIFSHNVQMEPEGFRRSARQLVSIADAYREDPDFRANLDSDPVATLAGIDVDVLPDSEVRVVQDTAKIFHFVLPPDFNIDMADEVLDMVAGGKSASAAPAPRVDRRIIRSAASGSLSTLGHNTGIQTEWSP